MENGIFYRGNGTYDLVFKALGDPHRIRIIELLRERELSAGEILEQVDVVQSTLSHHMKTLADSGAVNTTRHGKWTYYSLNEETFALAAAFLEKCARGTRTRKAEGEVPLTGAAQAKTIPEKSPEKSPEKKPEKDPGMSPAKSGGKDAVKSAGKTDDKGGKRKEKKNKKSKKSKK